MANLSDVFSEAGVIKALIVDDAFDPIPLASDLTFDAAEWDLFFDDPLEEDNAVLREIFPSYDEIDSEVLRTSDAFVSVLWNNQERLRPALIDPLFQRYKENTSHDHESLHKLNTQLNANGLICETTGRDFRDKALAADLILIDLFLGSSQDELAQGISIDGLFEVLRERSDKPPLVVLMSSSHRLGDIRSYFRDKSGLFESTFGSIEKNDLIDEKKLTRLLHLLASHYNDSLKLVKFVNAWESGIKKAGVETSKLIRRLDLSDHVNIKRLLLDQEGEPTGTYLVDVFDRALQHEVEADAAIIDAALALNSLTDDSCPPPHGPDALDLQDFVYSSQFQNIERLRLKGSPSMPVAFGDVLRRKPTTAAATGLPSGNSNEWPGTKIGEREVLVVLSPACDLQRFKSDSAQTILLLVGTLHPLAPSEWYPAGGEKEIRTPVVKLIDGKRYSIVWNRRHFETIQPDDLNKALSSSGKLEVIARLRETHTLELQQRLLSSLGRVGQLAAMPSTYSITVEAFYQAQPNGKLAKLELPTHIGNKAICYVGPENKERPNTRLVLGKDLCDALCQAITELDLTLVYSRAKEAVEHLKTSDDLWHILRVGAYLPPSSGSPPKAILSPSLEHSNTEKPRSIGLISRDVGLQEGSSLPSNAVPFAGIILVIRNLIENSHESNLAPTRR